MPLHRLKDYSIRDRNGDRVPANECNLQPLNILLPGNAPILVPKRTNRSEQQNATTIQTDKKRGSGARRRSEPSIMGREVVVATDDDDDDDDNDDDDFDKNPLLGKKTANRTAKNRAEPTMKSHSSENSHGRRLRKQAPATKVKAADQQERTAKRPGRDEQKKKQSKAAVAEQQEEYIVKLTGKYMAREYKAMSKKEKKSKLIDSESSISHGSDSATACIGSDGNDNDMEQYETTKSKKRKLKNKFPFSEGDISATDTSSRVRDILASLKIRAAGSDVNDTFTPSEEYQLLVLKKNGETWNDMSTSMNRPKNQLKKHYKHLKRIGTEIPDESENDGGSSSEDVSAISDTGAIIEGISSSDEASSDEKAAQQKKNKSAKSRNRKLQKKKPFREASNITAKVAQSDATTAFCATRLAAVTDTTPSEAAEETGIKAYIGQYAQQLIEDHRAGRVTIPEPDEKFGEDDCVLLALTNSRHATDRWLHIQAEFANLTGRLVPEEVLKWKLGEGEKPDDY
ncbi:hypothetical protein BD289DRAFT_489616 [Coniella lustricola]|uniref:Myb-like domain-containing protein n=1 Tax=Coniella lustricola TaxID=2025994 RepID=A0A2T3A1M5_9PEZI|nr:hypothetical protein BD289DRAFT_489616 [Coniella lustricola]